VWINSVHVVCGALVLTTSLVLTLRTWRATWNVLSVRVPADQLPRHNEVQLKPDAPYRARA
jgi:hypothetical protein